MKLAGKVVVITGAANGLGRALAGELSSHQAVVVAVDIDNIGLASIQNELPNITTIKADVTKESDLEKVIEDTQKIHSQMDIWINNAGVLGADGPALNQEFSDIEQVFSVNTLALIKGSILAAKYMLTVKSRGWIVNILSTSALGVRPGRSIYSSSKHAGHGFTQAFKRELKPLRVLAVYPDGIKTDLFAGGKPDNFDKFMSSSFVAKKIVDALIKDRTSDLVIKR